MGRITGGEISYSETRKIAEYENKTAKIVLSFGFDEEENYNKIIDGIQEQARERVRAMLGLKPAPETAKPVAAKAVAEVEDAPEEVAEPPKAKRGRKPAAKPVEEVAEVEDTPEEVVEEVAAEDDPLADLEDEPAPAIADTDLTKAIAKAKEKLGEDGGVLLRKHILKFATKIPLIPQDRREEFLEGLKTLK